MTSYPITDNGFYHLTRQGWMRRDCAPFPADRLETWSYQSECPADDAKEQVSLTRIWQEPHQSAECEAVRGHFGLPVAPSTARNIMLGCDV